MPKYVNARNVLPEKLLLQVYEHFPGGMLYFPSLRKQFNGKNKIIINLAEQGTSTSKIASLLGITRRRVNQIIAANHNLNQN
jgi:hypothetical protein